MISNKHQAPDEKKDHSDPKTYLKHFVVNKKAKKSDREVYVYLKEDPSYCELKKIKNICFEKGGDYNPYFGPIDSLFEMVENKYNKAVQSFEEAVYTDETKGVIAGMLSRLCIWNFNRRVRISSILHIPRHIYERGLIPRIAWDVPLWLSSSWVVLRNLTNTLFVTSDNPVCLASDNPMCVIDAGIPDPISIYMPLTPKVAILIEMERGSSDIQEETVAEERVKQLNTCMVDSAYKYVISSTNEEQIQGLVARCYHTDLLRQGIPFCDHPRYWEVKTTITPHVAALAK